MKIFLTYEEQVFHLEADNNSSEIIELLSRYNYYNLINSIKLIHFIGVIIIKSWAKHI